METAFIRRKQSPLLVATVATTAVILGVLFVQAFTLSWRAVALFPLAATFFLCCTLFLNHLREFLLFSLVFVLPFQLGYHVVFDPSALAAGAFRAGIVIDSVDVILFALYLGWIVDVGVLRRRHRRLSIGGSMGFLLLTWMLYLIAISLLVSERLDYSLYVIFEIFKAFLLFFYLVNNLDSEQDVKIVIYGLIANTVLHSIYICFQYVTHLNYTLHGELSHHYVPIEGFRPVGFTGSWDEAAILLATVLTIMFALSLVVAKRHTRLIDFFLMAMVVIGLLLTKMRSSWMAVFVSIPLVIAVSYIKRRIPSGLLVKVSVILAIIIIVASPFAIHRFVTGTKGENRIPLMLTALNMFEANWLTGVGAGNYLVHVKKYIPQDLRGAWVSTVHNEYLFRLAESGIFGFILYYLIFCIALKKLWRATHSSEPWVFAVSLGLFAVLVGSIPNRFFSVYHFVSTFMLYHVILALAFRLEQMDHGK